MSSIWEQESFFAAQDVIIAGAGFAGLWSGYYLKKLSPDLKILIIEKNLYPNSASTRNAGFACFGSVTELMDDARVSGEEKMVELVAMRYDGINRIRKVFRAGEINYQRYGGYELITRKQYQSKEHLIHDIGWLNDSLQKAIGQRNIFKLAAKKNNSFNFQGIDYLIENRLEAQLHPGKLVQALTRTLQSMGVAILAGTELQGYETVNAKLVIHTNAPVCLTTAQLLICTNGFGNDLLGDTQILPARGQILVTSPIKKLPFKGTFHYDEGFYYFRNLGNRVLLGGARNKAFKEEQTTDPSVSDLIQRKLELFLKEVILQGEEYTIDHRWSGIMGMGREKLPTIKEIIPNCFCAVGLGGMGVALAPVSGEQVAKMMIKARG